MLQVIDGPSITADSISHYSQWASSIAAGDSTYDHDGVLSASHSVAAILSKHAECGMFTPGWRGDVIELSKTSFVEYRAHGTLAGLLLADATSPADVLIHRVLVLPEFRRGGPQQPTPSVMTQLAHALIRHAKGIHERSGPPRLEKVSFRLAGVACVVSHVKKWQHIFAAYDGGGSVHCIASASPSGDESPTFEVRLRSVDEQAASSSRCCYL